METFIFDDKGNCLNPETVFSFEAGTWTCKITAAKHCESWVYGLTVYGLNAGFSHTISTGAPNFASKNEAIHHAVTTLIRYVEDYEKHYTTGLMPQKMKDKLLDFIKPQLKLFDI